MKVLVFSALFPPNTIGGAEMSAYNLARWLAANGHEVGVLTTARSGQDLVEDQLIDGFRTWRVDPPRPYRLADHQQARGWLKPVWHLQDHLDPRNAPAVGRVLDAFKPDFVNIHLVPGLGFNALGEIARRRIPALYVLPDLGLACIFSNMFRKGKDCPGQCTLCKVSSSFKRQQISRFYKIGFYSPSAANLATLKRYFPIADYPNAVLLNPNPYPVPTVPEGEGEHVRFLYVGRLHETKGVDVLLDAAEMLAAKRTFSVTIVGGGTSEKHLRERFGHHPWLTFTGRVSQQEVSNAMARSDVLCIPSIWAENSPGVVIHALGRGLAILGSDRGGIPELVENERNGMLLAPGDVKAWRDAMMRVIDEPVTLGAWRGFARTQSHSFDPEYLGGRIWDFMQQIAGEAGKAPASAT